MNNRNVSDYTDHIAKILPTEFVAVYLAVTQFANLGDHALRQPLLLVCLGVFFVLIPLFLIKVKGIKDYMHISIVVLSFLVWAYALGLPVPHKFRWAIAN